MKAVRWTSRDLEALPDDGKRYEIIDGELYVSKQPHFNHQRVCVRLGYLLEEWSDQTGLGVVTTAPGIIFSDDDDAVPDLAWISQERLATALENDGKLHSAPELVVEVLSPGNANENRDRDVKLKLYSRRGVSEYWIISWPKRQVEVYRRNQETLTLELVQTAYKDDTLKSSVLSGFSCQVNQIFKGIV